jgi:type I restriction enzyme S subunit
MSIATLHIEKKKSFIPKLRFQEFVESWNETLLNDVAEFRKGKGISKSDIIDDGNLECIRYGELYTTYNELIINIISKTNLPLKGLELSEYNDVIIPASGETQLDIATASCVLKSGVALSGDLNIIRSSLNGIFLSFYLNNKKKLDIAKLAQGSSVVHLYSSQLKSLKLNIPTLPEQQKIASFLSAVDEKIQQLSRKKVLLEQYKKGVMQQLFSGKLRFKDENGKNYADWEEKKLGDIGIFQTSSIDKLSKDNELEVYLVNYMNVYRHEEISNNTVKHFQVVTAKENQINSCDLKKGDILFTPSSETPSDIGHSVVIFEDIKNAVYSYHLMRFRPKRKIDILYSHYFCNIPEILNQLSKLATGSTRFTISVKSFSSIEVKLPCLEEQQKIAKFLSSIDAKLESISQQINQTQSFKKGLLQQLFV